jgi:CheY-like chemotaxis protein
MTARKLLYVEDSFDDRYLFIKAAERAEVSFRVLMVEDGQEAIDYLSGAKTFADRKKFPVPELVLLDLKMPGVGGFEVLDWIRAQSTFRELPVFVFTSSYQHVDIQRAYARQATAFLTKPSDFSSLVRLARAVNECFSSKGVRIEPVKSLPQYKRP